MMKEGQLGVGEARGRYLVPLILVVRLFFLWGVAM